MINDTASQMAIDWLETSGLSKPTPSPDHFASQEAKMVSSSRSALAPVSTSSHYKPSTSPASQDLSGTDPEEHVDWRHAYHHNQAQLARVRGELVRSQEVIAKQHHEIKQLQAQLLSMREQVLKEIYDLRDLVLDK